MISFYLAPMNGIHGLNIGYSSPEPKLSMPRSDGSDRSLTLEEVNPLLEVGIPVSSIG